MAISNLLCKILFYFKLIFLFTILFSGCFLFQEESSSVNTVRSYSLAMEQYQAKNYNEALKYINEAIAANDKIAQYFELKGDILSGEKNYTAALQEYNRARSLRFSPAIIIKTGRTQYNLKNYNEAVKNYKLAFAQNEEQIGILLLLVNCYIQQKELDLSLNHLKEFKTLAESQKKPVDPGYFILEGKIFFEKGQFQKAITAVEKANGAQNRNECIFYLSALFKNNEEEKAYKLITNDYRNILTQADIHYFRGLYYYKKENYNVAKTQLELSVQERTQFFDAYKLLSELYLKDQETDLANEIFNSGKKYEKDRIINMGLDI